MSSKVQEPKFQICDQEYEEGVDINSIQPTPDNPHKADELMILRFIKANGFYGAIVCRKETRTIIAGEHRWKALRRAKVSKVNVLWLNVDGVTATRIMLADNRVASGSFNDEALLRAAMLDVVRKDGLLGHLGMSLQSKPVKPKEKNLVSGKKSTLIKFNFGDYTFRVDSSVYDMLVARLLAKSDSSDVSVLGQAMADLIGVKTIGAES